MASEAEKEKLAGNDAYKAKNFAEAHQHYDKAIELEPNNIVFMNNKAAVFIEEGKFQECIDLGSKAVEIGREHKADYKAIAKSLERIGRAYYKLKDYANALKYLDKSLSEHRDQKIYTERLKIEKEKKEAERKAMFSPEKAEEEKALGNQYFKDGKYPEAKKHYDQAILYNPDDVKLYSNRAATFTKLMAFPEAVKDCDSAIALDPTFVKAYIRKGHALIAMKEASRAQKAFEDGLKQDPNNKELEDGLRNCAMTTRGNPEEARKRALEDPEIQKILGDPAMRSILEQMQTDPKALQEHLKNPEIASRISKLIDCGIIGVR